jgi:hypothetical protein
MHTELSFSDFHGDILKEMSWLDKVRNHIAHDNLAQFGGHMRIGHKVCHFCALTVVLSLCHHLQEEPQVSPPHRSVCLCRDQLLQTHFPF